MYMCLSWHEQSGNQEILQLPRNDEDNRSDQMNPNNDAYWDSRGYDGRPDDWEDRVSDDHDYDNDNRSNQMNPNNDAYHQSRS